jgi:hypothetical protein
MLKRAAEHHRKASKHLAHAARITTGKRPVIAKLAATKPLYSMHAGQAVMGFLLTATL